MNEMSQSKIGVRLLPQPGSLSLSGLIPHPGLQPSVGVLDPGSPKSTRPSIAPPSHFAWYKMSWPTSRLSILFQIQATVELARIMHKPSTG